VLSRICAHPGLLYKETDWIRDGDITQDDMTLENSAMFGLVLVMLSSKNHTTAKEILVFNEKQESVLVFSQRTEILNLFEQLLELFISKSRVG
jgi:SNF2 family DNA or RNA helicase